MTGNFNRLDPFFGNLQDPQSLHKYLYTHGDPVNGIDPSGAFLGFSLSTTIGIGKQIGYSGAAITAGSAALGGLGFVVLGGNFWEGVYVGATASLAFQVARITGRLADTTWNAVVQGFVKLGIEYLYREAIAPNRGQLTGGEAARIFLTGFSSGAVSTAFKGFFPDATPWESAIASGLIGAFKSAVQDFWANIFVDPDKPLDDIAVDALVDGTISFVANAISSGAIDATQLQVAQRFVAENAGAEILLKNALKGFVSLGFGVLEKSVAEIGPDLVLQ